jgi:hypothetical protein
VHGRVFGEEQRVHRELDACVSQCRRHGLCGTRATSSSVSLSGDGDSDDGRLSAFAWAFDGLALFLRQAATRFGDAAATHLPFLASLAAWMVRVPLQIGELTVAAVEEELTVLAKKIFTRGDKRELFAQHLLAQWPGASTPHLQRVLADLGYMNPPRRL